MQKEGKKNSKRPCENGPKRKEAAKSQNKEFIEMQKCQQINLFHVGCAKKWQKISPKKNKLCFSSDKNGAGKREQSVVLYQRLLSFVKVEIKRAIMARFNTYY